MVYYTINAYDADFRVPQFKGLQQYGDGFNGSPIYATELENMDTPAGVLQPAAAPVEYPVRTPSPIKTLAVLYRRWYTGVEDKTILIAASDGYLFAITTTDGTPQIHQLSMPASVNRFKSSTWSWVAYEINPEGSDAPVDVLLLSNAKDGMYMVRGDDLTVVPVPTPKKFGVIERHAERIWGGAIEDDPDMLVYSAPFDPTDWEANTEIPEDGAGDVSQPSWDGDEFTALRTFGNQLIAFKRTKVWRVVGTNPGEYTFYQQYGGGAPYANTIVVDTDRIIAITDQGPVYYDGSTVNPYQQEAVKELFRRVNKPQLDNACACIFHNILYISLPIDGSEINNAVLIYNRVDQSWLLRTDLHIESFLPTEDTLYYTSSTTPGTIWVYAEDSWKAQNGTKSVCRWVSPWQDFNMKRYGKGPFEVHFVLEAQKGAKISLSIETEHSIKRKEFKRDLERQGPKQLTAHFPVNGTRFRFILEAPANNNAWRIIGGIHMIVDHYPY